MDKEILTTNAKYIFIDIVRYTTNRSVEAQTDLIGTLNEIVRECVSSILEATTRNVLYIPTGDGMCIALLDLQNPYDAHIKIALSILERVEVYNKGVDDEMRNFQLRIGINENLDNLVVDINGLNNVAGSGINFASRILSLCDENQILVGSSVYDKLSAREHYMKSFKEFTGEVKHGVKLKVHQYVNKELLYLNSSTPSAFASKNKPEPALTPLIAHYFGLCLANENFTIESTRKGGQQVYSLTVLYFFKAQDTLAKSYVTRSKPDHTEKLPGTIAEEFTAIQQHKFWVVCDFAHSIRRDYLEEFSVYLDENKLLLNEYGIRKLEKEAPSTYIHYKRLVLKTS